MKRKTHAIVGTVITAPVIILTGTPLIYTVVAFIGTIAPDWDLHLGLKHRGASHSMLAALISGVVVGGLLDFRIGFVWIVAYSSHLFLDSLTKMGVPVLYPISSKRYGLRKFRTNGIMDNWYIILGTLFALLVVLEVVVNFILSFVR